MTSDQRAAFIDLSREMHNRGVSNIAEVFVPVGPAVDDLRPCVMYVGRATRDYLEERLPVFERAVCLDPRVVEDQQSSHWAFLRYILRSATLEVTRSTDKEPPISAAWSNLIKIGDTKGKPSPLSCSIQAEACIRALRFEIDMLQPAVIVLATGTWQKETLLDPVFEVDGWSGGAEFPTRWKIDAPSRALVIHTYHPERKRRSRETAISIGGMIAQHVGTTSSSQVT